ncbi:MAG: 3-dehydroquinate synthase [Gemmatimonadales bacterium]|nr:3-dehydroquinate synthase [Gemmatimonadales bacterium]
MPIATLPVIHGRGRYDVQVGAGALARLPAVLAERAPSARAVVLADQAVLAHLSAWERGGGPWGALGLPLRAAAQLAVPSGEAAKTRDTWAELTDRLLDLGVGRDAVLVAVGGGVTGDLAGFVAATYLRGIPLLQAPTTLLAMVDASVGGKVGVDTRHGKNLVGAFHPPIAVLADTATLATLPARELRGGLVEALKHGLVADASYLDWIEDRLALLLGGDPEALAGLVEGSVRIKAAIVGEDEHERGRRAVLNAGHTVAHALEHVSGYALHHGEAVGLGLVAEGVMAESLGLDPGVTQRMASLLVRAGLSTRLAQPLPAEAVRAAMATDKKARAGLVRFALPEAVGRMQPGDGRWTVPLGDAVIARGLAAIGCA